ncbi:MAG TPA: hypothetical protein VNL94_00135 [Candidatus Binatia bacterium]|nr:hypothetical protein [Candidatus Binatia bacterium]
MTAIVLPKFDKSTVDELLRKMPDLKEIELPSLPKMEEVGKTADETIDRLLGRSKAPVWPWVAAGIGLVALIGVVAAYFAFWRRPAWETPSEPWEATTTADAGDDIAVPGVSGASDETTGLTAAESSLSTSTSSNPQEV